MKKISTPHPNNFPKKEESKSYSDITIEDLDKFWEENKYKFPLSISDLGNGNISIKGKGVFGIVPKKMFNDALLEEGKKYLPL